jgi:hypothetical protein
LVFTTFFLRIYSLGLALALQTKQLSVLLNALIVIDFIPIYQANSYVLYGREQRSITNTGDDNDTFND